VCIDQVYFRLDKNKKYVRKHDVKHMLQDYNVLTFITSLYNILIYTISKNKVLPQHVT